MAGIVTYQFLPWVRAGLASQLRTTDTLGGGVPGRARLDVGLTVTRQSGAPVVVTRGIEVIGPGDVVGIDRRQVIRTDPKPNATDFEPNFLAIIEFDRPEFPWLFTPAAANAQNRLRPWLVLVVVEVESEVSLEAQQGVSLPVLAIPTSARPSRQLPDLEESWAWAHGQVLISGSERLEDILEVGSSADGVTADLPPTARRRTPATWRAWFLPSRRVGGRASAWRRRRPTTPRSAPPGSLVRTPRRRSPSTTRGDSLRAWAATSSRSRRRSAPGRSRRRSADTTCSSGPRGHRCRRLRRAATGRLSSCAARSSRRSSGRCRGPVRQELRYSADCSRSSTCRRSVWAVAGRRSRARRLPRRCTAGGSLLGLPCPSRQRSALVADAQPRSAASGGRGPQHPGGPARAGAPDGAGLGPGRRHRAGEHGVALGADRRRGARVTPAAPHRAAHGGEPDPGHEGGSPANAHRVLHARRHGRGQRPARGIADGAVPTGRPSAGSVRPPRLPAGRAYDPPVCRRTCHRQACRRARRNVRPMVSSDSR